MRSASTWIRRSLLGSAILLLVVGIGVVGLWHDRPNLDEIDWPPPAAVSSIAYEGVTATWLGVSTLLFDDGETQILIDGFFSRPTLAESIFRRPVRNDVATINAAMNEFRMRRLAAIIPVHSHFDHAMDVGAIANRSSASVLGSFSTAQIARGAGVPEDQIIIVDETQDYQFGQFQISLLRSPHAPVGWRGTVPFDGTIDSPVLMPQPISAFRMGGAWTIIVKHPQGSALVVGSAGFNKYRLRSVQADVVFLGVGMLDTLDEKYTELYWQHTVTATGAGAVYPVHFDDLQQPFGTITAMPAAISDLSAIVTMLERYRDRWDSQTQLYLPRFGEPIAIYDTAGR